MKKNLFFYYLFSFCIFFNSSLFSSSLIPELKKSINYQCKNDDSYKNINECRRDLIGQLISQGTDFIYRVKDKTARKDLIVQCNLKRKNALEFNSCLFDQVSIFFGEDTTIVPPVILEIEKNSEDEDVSVVTPPDGNEKILINRLIKSSFFVEVTDDLNGYEFYTGSAVKVNSTDLLTACHVVYNENTRSFRKYIFISSVDHKDNQERFEARVKEYDLEKDACVITSTKIKNYPSVPDIKDFNKIDVYEKVYGIGNPNGFVGRTVEGKITSLYKATPYQLRAFQMNSTKFDPGQLIESNAPVDTGNSGGGFYDSQGKLIGILSVCETDFSGQCRVVNPLNWAIPASSFVNLTKFDLEKDFKIDDDNDYITKNDESDNEYITKKEKYEDTENIKRNWIYNDKNDVLSTTSNNEHASFRVTYYWKETDQICLANLILYHIADNENDLKKFNSIIGEKFSFEILGQQPEEFDQGFVGTIYEEYNDVSLVLISLEYKKNMFKNRLSSNGKLVVELKSPFLKNYTKKTFYSFNNLGLNEFSEKAYDYCMKNKSSLS